MYRLVVQVSEIFYGPEYLMPKSEKVNVVKSVR